MTLRTAVVGAGVVASNNHFPALSRNPRTELRAVCDVDADRAEEAAAEFGARSYADVGTMLSEESLDWVHVATPVGTHLELGRRVLEAGVPLLVQKPATTTRDELEELTDLADDRDVPVSVVHNWLYYPVVREVRRRIADGDVGPVRAVQTTVAGEGPPDETYRGDWVFDLPGGSLEEGMPHPLYLTLALGGYPRDESSVDVRTRLVGEYDRDVAYDGVQLQYVGEGGTLCSVTQLSDSSRGTAVRVLGADGSLTVDFPSMTVDERDAEAGPYHFPEERFRRNLAVSRNAVEGLARNLRKYGKEYVEDEFDVHLRGSPDGHYYLLDRASRALEAGRRPPCDPEESYWTLTLVERVREAARESRSD
ncbi:Gfo/Idh/MocA family protein [Halorarum salinum]|uniref:Gfo/Idh/MocA family oxidoreductase n=1 Tax=Halorarum salinum TaxID=2743089 RepID=A0A7D5L8W8_9EURY|nr:Gfo/Idh/MocA family oxidoreductase [Halobaculum salinum]QLG60429.1 Gfo/Idh/MocA family oxidoreductase [Halobaculum salinum]